MNNLEKENEVNPTISDEISADTIVQDSKLPNVEEKKEEPVQQSAESPYSYTHEQAQTQAQNKSDKNQGYTNPNTHGSNRGTVYSNQNTQQYQYEPPKKQGRRVGTFTMGVALIATGLAVIASLIVPNFDYIMLLKFTPLLLVFLGLEVITFSFFYKNGKIRYDFLSGFVCFLIICGSLALAAVPTAYKMFGPERYELEQRLEDDVTAQLQEKINSEKEIVNISTYLSLNSYRSGDYDKISYKDLYRHDYLSVNIEVEKKFKDEKEFAEHCEKIIKKIYSTNIHFANVTISQSYTSGTYGVTLDDVGQRGYSVSSIMDRLIDQQQERREIKKGEITQEIYDEVREELRVEFTQELQDEVREEIANEIHDEVRDSVEEQLRSDLYDEVRTELREELYDEVKQEIIDEQ